jgi:hypothetical protein
VRNLCTGRTVRQKRLHRSNAASPDFRLLVLEGHDYAISFLAFGSPDTDREQNLVLSHPLCGGFSFATVLSLRTNFKGDIPVTSGPDATKLSASLDVQLLSSLLLFLSFLLQYIVSLGFCSQTEILICLNTSQYDGLETLPSSIFYEARRFSTTSLR